MERSSPYVGIREGETFCDAADWNETVIESGIRDLIRLIPFVQMVCGSMHARHLLWVVQLD